MRVPFLCTFSFFLADCENVALAENLIRPAQGMLGLVEDAESFASSLVLNAIGLLRE